MTDDYNLAKPDPTPPVELPPYMVDVNLPADNNLAPGEQPPSQFMREDLSGFRAGQDRMFTAPEFLERSRAEQPEGRPPFRYPSSRGHQPTGQRPPGLRFEELHPHGVKIKPGLRPLAPGRYLVDENGDITPDPITKDTSDGYHSFKDLYAHRRALTAALAEMVTRFVWRDQSAWKSRNHHPEDGPMFDESFIVGIDLPTGAILYHYNNRYWDDFKNVPELEHAPKWDGAGPETTITRLLDFARA